MKNLPLPHCQSIIPSSLNKYPLYPCFHCPSNIYMGLYIHIYMGLFTFHTMEICPRLRPHPSVTAVIAISHGLSSSKGLFTLIMPIHHLRWRGCFSRPSTGFTGIAVRSLKWPARPNSVLSGLDWRCFFFSHFDRVNSHQKGLNDGVSAYIYLTTFISIVLWGIIQMCLPVPWGRFLIGERKKRGIKRERERERERRGMGEKNHRILNATPSTLSLISTDGIKKSVLNLTEVNLLLCVPLPAPKILDGKALWTESLLWCTAVFLPYLFAFLKSHDK